MVADQPGADFAVQTFAGLHQCLTEIMIAVTLVDEAFASARHRDHAGLGAVVEMRERAHAAVAAWPAAERHPGSRVGQFVGRGRAHSTHTLYVIECLSFRRR